MKKFTATPIILALLSLLFACGKEEQESSLVSETFTLENVVNGNNSSNASTFADVDPQLSIELSFSDDIDSSTTRYITLKDTSGNYMGLKCNVSGKKVVVTSDSVLSSYSTYKLYLGSGLKSTNQVSFSSQTLTLKTALDSTDKFDRITDEELLDLVQSQTFKYFWDNRHPTSGMALERASSPNTVTTGGTGFAIMTIIVGIERDFISRTEGLERILKIVNFLNLNCTRYHGAFSHWINGTTGETIPFSTYDDGGDLVETAFLFQGLLTARAYFDQEDSEEVALRNLVTTLWEEVEWTWFQKNGESALYWHWSPNYGWQINQQISGWSEALIVYVLASSSPTYPISKDVYDNGWAGSGSIKNGSQYYGYTLPLGESYGGPLFFTHYSFLGLDPTGLSDEYANYFTQNQNHALINYSYCVANPSGFTGYSTDCWGLSASDGNAGYSAFSPTNDQGVIAPTAALSSMPYTPEKSLDALRFFYYKLGDKIWKDYGFVDAFNLSEQWFDSDFLAIDQGPIVVMIENYRTGLIWNLFMNIEEIQNGYTKLGFQVSK
ncbi:MAG: hypothetical protein H6Q14_2740 [Bacteroidetes bacterium]|nr:hypothetical protein [Bacteroidota bacterium]